MFLIDLKPMDPEDIPILQVGHGGVHDLDLVDPKDPRIRVWVGWITVGESHHIQATSHVNLVRSPPQVIHGVVYGHRVVLLKVVSGDEDLFAIVGCERRGFRIVLAMEDASEEMVFQLRDEVLVRIR